MTAPEIRAEIGRCSSLTAYGRRKAARLAAELATITGRKVYLQRDYGTHVAADDGRGPFNLGAPWTEHYPSTRVVTP